MSTPHRAKVGLVIGQLTYGGAESQLYELAKVLQRSCDVVVYCLSTASSPYAERLGEAGVEVKTLESRGSFDPARIRRLARFFRDDGIEVAHAFLFIASAYAYLATKLARGVALVTSARNCKLETNPVRRLVMRRAFRASQAVICNSHAMSRFAVRHYSAPPERVHVVYNGVDTTRFTSGYDLDNALSVGTIGRIEAQKNLDMFVEAAARVLKERHGYSFYIVGDGSLRAQVEEKVRAGGVAESVVFRGTTSDVPGFLSELGQFWLTSSWEGTPNVVLEAMAAGVPVLATDVGATSELVEDGRTGFLVPSGDVTKLSECSLRLATDQALAARMSSRAKEVVATKFSIEAMVAQTLVVYDQVLGGAT